MSGSVVRLSDLRVAHGLLMGPWRYEPWARYRRHASAARVAEVRELWRQSIDEALVMRRDAVRRRQMRELGEHFGYPTCCIDDCCRRAEAMQNAQRGAMLPAWARQRLVEMSRPTAAQAEAAQDTGFVPCPTHAAEVLRSPEGPERRAALAALIAGRTHPQPFPEDGIARRRPRWS